MKPKRLLLAVALLPLPAAAVDFAIEEEGLAALPKYAEEAIRTDNDFVEYRDCRLIGKAVDLTGEGKKSGVIATTANACAWGAALGPVWVVRAIEGKAQVVLSSGGYSVTLGTKTQSGLRHISISAGTAGWYSESLWKFDGEHYVKVKQTNGIPR